MSTMTDDNYSVKSVHSIDSLAMPKRQKVFDKTFLPAGDLQPVWGAIPLDQKIPVCPSPRGAYTFYTNKVGEPKYINNQRLDFDLTNPQGREAPMPYDSLQDPSLKTYFTSPRTKRHLVDNGLITHRGEIICNVKEFNEYRSFVRYRSVTELSLMKKQEKRLQQEEKDSIYTEWPNIHKKKHKKRDKRLVYSEPPRHRSEPVSGLDMYKEDLSAGLRRSETIRRENELRRSGRTPIITPSPRKTSGYGDLSPRRADSSESQLFGNQKLSLVEEMRRREQQLKNRIETQRKEREEEHRRRMEENWRDRQRRQEQLLAHEAEVEAKVKEERTIHIIEREKTITQQRTHQEAQLKKLRNSRARTHGQSQAQTRQSNYHSSNEDVSDKKEWRKVETTRDDDGNTEV